MTTTRTAIADAILTTAITFEQVYLPLNMERTFAPNLSRITDAEWVEVCEIRGRLVALQQRLNRTLAAAKAQESANATD